MDYSKGFIERGQKKEEKSFKLTKFQYILKQTSTQWYGNFDYCMLNNGCNSNECDKCIYHKIIIRFSCHY